MLSRLVTLGAAINAGCALIALAQHHWPVLLWAGCGAFGLGLLHILLGKTP
jgi:hypothetical protein